MSQISPPLRFLLIGSVVFLAAWFVFLKPGGGTDATPPATPATPAVSNPNAPTSTALGGAVQKANGAAAQQTAANAAHGDETQSAASPPATSAPAKPAAPANTKVDVSGVGLPPAVAQAVAANKVLVLLFWNPKAADDRIVRREMRNVGSRHKREVSVHVANVDDIAVYAPLVPKDAVQQSPSVVVIGKDRKATVLQGYSDQLAIEQAVSDALRDSR
jgi:hypothetical protein